jgi:hypothetical protein
MYAFPWHLQYTHHKSALRRGTFWHRNGPTLLLTLATPLLLADMTRHCLQDADLWPGGPWPGSSMYKEDCSPVTVSHLCTLLRFSG